MVGFVVRGLVVGALLGAAAGLVLGLIAYPPTVWFAILEVGVPAGYAGAAIGLVTGAIVTSRRRIRDKRIRDTASKPESIPPD